MHCKKTSPPVAPRQLPPKRGGPKQRFLLIGLWGRVAYAQSLVVVIQCFCDTEEVPQKSEPTPPPYKPISFPLLSGLAWWFGS